MTKTIQGARFQRFMAARFITTLGDNFLLFALPLIVLKITGSLRMAGLAFFIEWLPRVLSLPFAGAIVDRVGGLRVLKTSDLVRAILCAATFFLVRGADPQTAFVLLTGLSAIVAFFAA